MAPKVGEKGPAKKGPAKKAADGKKKKKISKAETYKIYIYSECTGPVPGAWGRALCGALLTAACAAGFACGGLDCCSGPQSTPVAGRPSPPPPPQRC